MRAQHGCARRTAYAWRRLRNGTADGERGILAGGSRAKRDSRQRKKTQAKAGHALMRAQHGCARRTAYAWRRLRNGTADGGRGILTKAHKRDGTANNKRGKTAYNRRNILRIVTSASHFYHLTNTLNTTLAPFYLHILQYTFMKIITFKRKRMLE